MCPTYLWLVTGLYLTEHLFILKIETDSLNKKAVAMILYVKYSYLQSPNWSCDVCHAVLLALKSSWLVSLWITAYLLSVGYFLGSQALVSFVLERELPSESFSLVAEEVKISAVFFFNFFFSILLAGIVNYFFNFYILSRIQEIFE